MHPISISFPPSVSRMGLLICLSAGLSFIGEHRTTAAETAWPEFRGPTGQGLSAARNIPTEWNATNHVTWKSEIPGTGWSSPVAAGGKIYLTTAVTEPALSLRALCLNATDGKIIWDVEVFQPDESGAKTHHQKNGLASPTPILTQDRLFVHFGHLGSAALDLSGKVLWRQSDLKYPPVHGNGGSPALVDGKLVFACDGGADPFVVALDAGSGEVKWKTPRNTKAKKTFSFCTPLVIENGGRRELIIPGSGFVAGYDIAGGQEIWRARYGEGYSVVPRPLFVHGLLYICSGFDRPILLAIKPGGAGDITETNIVWQLAKGIPNTPSLIADGGEIYFVSDGGIASCVDALTGAVQWSERLGGNFSASPVLAEGRIYFLNEAGTCFVVRAGRSFELLATNELSERALASPAVVDGALLIRTEHHLWRIGQGGKK